MSDNNIRKIMKEADAPEMIAERIRETAQTIKAQSVSKRTEGVSEDRFLNVVPKRNRWSWKKVAVLTAAAVCVIGGTVFAAAAYRMNLQKTDSYAISAELTAEEALPDSVPAVTVKPGYIPAGFVYDEEKAYYVNEAGNAGYCIGTEPLLLDRAESFAQTEIADAEVLKINGRDALYTCAEHNAADPAWIDQHLYLAWPEASRVVTGWAWGHADKAELVKMMEETELTLDETTVSTRDLDCWSDYTAWLNSNTDVIVDDFITSASAEEMAQTHQLGEEFPLKEEGALFATVTDVKIMEDISLLNKELIQDDWKALVDDSGRLLEDEILYMKEGDGISTMSEIVRSEKEPVKLVYATVEYRNDTAEDMSDVWFLSTLVPMTEEGGTYRLLAQGGKDYDYTQNATGIVGTPEVVFYCDVNGEGTVKNYIPFIAAGESATVHYAWLMNENQLEDSLYMDLTAATMYSIMPESLETGLVKVK